MKYRIKVMPYKGQLIYVPQKAHKCFWWTSWRDMILPSSCGTYDKDFAMRYISSEFACLKFIEMVDNQNREERERKEFEKKFAKNNPVRYIEVVS